MIKINKKDRPTELTDDIVDSLTREFIKTKKPVWKQKYIEQALLESSFSKCCYCEIKLNIEAKYMEVEHYYDKNHFPERVVDWDNLLPSCKRCNGKKSDHDTSVEPIVNPAITNPKDHFYSRSYRYEAKTEIASTTIDLLGLNDTDKLVYARFQVGAQVHNLIDILHDKLSDYINDVRKPTIKRNKVVTITKGIMNEALPSAQFCAITATELVHSEKFNKVISELKSLNLWDDDMEEMFYMITENAYDMFNPRVSSSSS